MHKDQYQSHVSVADMTAKPEGGEHNEEETRLTVSPLAQATTTSRTQIFIVLTESQCSMRITCK